MRGGNNRKPKSLKLLHGTFRADRNPGTEPEAERIAEVPRPPSYLNKWAKKMWKRLAEKLTESGVLTYLDLEALEITCAAYGEYRAAYEAIYCQIKDEETGKKRRQTFTEYMAVRNSQTMPEYIAMKSAWEKYRAYASDFGLNPVARNRIELPEPEDENPMEAFFDEAK